MVLSADIIYLWTRILQIIPTIILKFYLNRIIDIRQRLGSQQWAVGDSLKKKKKMQVLFIFCLKLTGNVQRLR